MKKMFKYEIKDAVLMPTSAKIRKFGLDRNHNFCVWAEVNPNAGDFKDFYFKIIPTGDQVPEYLNYFDTTILRDGSVWHLYVSL